MKQNMQRCTARGYGLHVSPEAEISTSIAVAFYNLPTLAISGDRCARSMQSEPTKKVSVCLSNAMSSRVSTPPSQPFPGLQGWTEIILRRMQWSDVGSLLLHHKCCLTMGMQQIRASVLHCWLKISWTSFTLEREGVPNEALSSLL